MIRAMTSPSVTKAEWCPMCPQCGATMTMFRTDPITPGTNQRTFKCECGRSETLMVRCN